MAELVGSQCSWVAAAISQLERKSSLRPVEVFLGSRSESTSPSKATSSVDEDQKLANGRLPLLCQAAWNLLAHVSEAHQTLRDLAAEWERGCGEDQCQLERFFYHVRCLREACNKALGIEHEVSRLDVVVQASPRFDEKCIEVQKSVSSPAKSAEPPMDLELASVSPGSLRTSLVNSLLQARMSRQDSKLSSNSPTSPGMPLATHLEVSKALKARIPPLDFTRLASSPTPPKLSFRLNCHSTRMGQHVRVVGSCTALGDWAPERGVPTCTTANDFPWWASVFTVRVCPHVVIEYKYVICSQSGEAVQWEDGQNRRLHLASAMAGARLEGKPHVVVADIFNVTGGAKTIHSASGLDLAAVSAICTTRLPASDMPLLTPTARSMATSATATKNDSQLLGPACGASSLQLMRESFSTILECKGSERSSLSTVFTANYELVGDGPLAAGSFGIVWRCRSRPSKMEGTDGECAAKVIYKEKMLAQDPEGKIDVEAEACLHVRLKHPNIVNLAEFFNESKVMTLVLEFCRGGDLFDAILAASGRRADGFGLEELGAATMARHVLSALAYLHSCSIAHRDIKCENILLAMACTPPALNTFKLCDFGFAAVDDGSGLHGQVGSPDTVAPEVLAGKTYSFPADLWSMGVVLYMALAAEAPFQASSDQKVLQLVLVGDYSLRGGPWSTVSSCATKLVASLMTVNPTLRPEPCQALSSEWLTFSTSLEQPAHSRERLGRPAQLEELL